MGRLIARPLAFCLGLAALLPLPASAYVRDVTSTGLAIAWHNPCVTMHVYVGAPPPVLAAEDLLAASAQALAAWSYPQVPGTDIRLSMTAEVESEAGIGNDSRNVIVLRQTTWCRTPTPINHAGIAEPECYPSSALAITSIFKNVRTGEIVDADMEFNAVNYTWGDRVGQPGLAMPTTADFQNALTHELGHVLGLAHNCFTLNDGSPRLNDNTGAPAVDCYGDPPPSELVTAATMYPSVVLTDTERRTLTPDDVQGIVEIYPHANDVCPSASGGGCRMVSSSSAERPWPEIACALFVTLLASLMWRRVRDRV